MRLYKIFIDIRLKNSLLNLFYKNKLSIHMVGPKSTYIHQVVIFITGNQRKRPNYNSNVLPLLSSLFLLFMFRCQLTTHTYQRFQNNNTNKIFDYYSNIFKYLIFYHTNSIDYVFINIVTLYDSSRLLVLSLFIQTL